MPSTQDADTDASFVYCADCGKKAAISWSFCRNCQSSLDDALTPAEAPERTVTDELPNMEETGCPKCGHEKAEVDEIATTGSGLSKLFDIQNRRFQVVSCANCGYSELYRDRDADVIVDLFIG